VYARYPLNPLSFPSKKKKKDAEFNILQQMCFAAKSWLGDATEEICFPLILKALCISILHRFDINVLRSHETVIDNSDSAIVASIWVMRKIGRVLAYDFISCRTGFVCKQI